MSLQMTPTQTPGAHVAVVSGHAPAPSQAAGNVATPAVQLAARHWVFAG
jgi:hypothetical protein